MNPRPILKQRAPLTQRASHAVHFPPSPALTRTFSAHSPQSYDRSPIEVSPNSCALPERGCPGRTYTLEERPRTIACARDYHPRALAFASANNPSAMPPLVPDLSSESDESDGFCPVPASSSSFIIPRAPHPQTLKPAPAPVLCDLALAYTDDGFAYPHPDDARTYRLRAAAYPTPPAPAPVYPPALHAEDVSATQQRRRRERRHESSRDPDRIPGGEAPGLATLSPQPPSSPRRKGVRRTQAPSRALASGGGFGVPDDGCLGGF